MKLQQLADEINKLVSEGHGGKWVFYRHTASGDCGAVWGAQVTDSVDDSGPFDLDEPEYVALNVGGF